MTVYYGYFKSYNDSTPFIDPGIQVPCPFCGSTVATNPADTNILTSSFFASPDIEGYLFFWRGHMSCSNNATGLQRIAIQTAAMTQIQTDYAQGKIK